MKQALKEALRPYVKPYQRSFRKFKKQSKSLMLLPLRALPMSSEKLRPPRGLYFTLEEWEKSLSSKEEGEFTVVAKSEALFRKKPHTIEDKIHWIIEKEYKKESPDASVCYLRNGRVWVTHNNMGHVNSTAHITEDDHVIIPISDEFNPNPREHSIFSQFKLPNLHHIQGRAISLVTMKGEHFYHWIYDLLPKLASLERAGISIHDADAIIINSSKSRFMKDTLAALGIPMEKLVDTQTYKHLKADELIVPSTPAGVGNPTRWICDFLRDRFLPIKAKLPADTSERVLISRAHAPARKVLNEDAIEKVAVKYGFKKYTLEKMSYLEQVALFNQAKIILTPHGAGLSGLVYCEEGTQVLEFYHPQYVNACFYALANTMKLDYSYFIGKGKAPKEGVDLAMNMADITLDTEKLEKAIKAIL
ncbi:MAG: glycosyltransferase family 61 protein [Bacteroidota bacterium]